MARTRFQPGPRSGAECAAARKLRREAPTANRRRGKGERQGMRLRGVQGGRARRAAPPWPPPEGRAEAEAPARWCQSKAEARAWAAWRPRPWLSGVLAT